MGARSYIPQLGRFLQTDPVPGGSANAYTYTYGNPVNESDPTGELTYGITEGGLIASQTASREAVSEALAREQATREEAERKASELFDGGPEVVGSRIQARSAGRYSAVAVAAAPCARDENPKTNHCNSKGRGEILVHFAGHTSTPAQILQRAKAEYRRNNQNVLAIKNGLSELMKGVKETWVPIENAAAGVKAVIYELMRIASNDPLPPP